MNEHKHVEEHETKSTMEDNRETFFEYRECLLCNAKLIAKITDLLEQYSEDKIIEFLGYLRNVENLPTTLPTQIREVLTELNDFRSRKQIRHIYFDKCVFEITLILARKQFNIHIALEMQSSERSMDPSQLSWGAYALYQGSEVFEGIKTSLYGTYSTFRHPIATVKGMYGAIASPKKTALVLANQIKNYPVRFAASFLTGMLTNVVISKGVSWAYGKASGKLTKLKDTNMKVEQGWSDEYFLNKEYWDKTAELEKLEKAEKAAKYAYIDSLKENTNQIVQKGEFFSKTDSLFAEFKELQVRVFHLKKGIKKVLGKLDTVKDTTKKLELVADSLIQDIEGMNFQKTAMAECYIKKRKEAVESLAQKHSNFRAIYYKRLFLEKLGKLAISFMEDKLKDPQQWYQGEKRKLPKPKNLVFEGGGPKGLVFVGALNELQHHGLLSKVEYVGGTSAGAITALLIAVGYSPEEISELLNNFNLSNFLDEPELKNMVINLVSQPNLSHNLLKLLLAQEEEDKRNYVSNALREHQGLFPGEILRSWLEERVIDKLCQYNERFKDRAAAKFATFEDLTWLQAKGYPVKSLAVVGADVSTHVPSKKIFSTQKTPNALIVDAVRISVSIPGIFFPHKVYIRKNGQRVLESNTQEHLFVDGGIFANFPITIFDHLPNVVHTDTLGLRIEDNLMLYESFLRRPNIPERLPSENRINRMLKEHEENLKKLFSESSLVLLKELVDINHALQIGDAIFFSAQQLATHSSEEDWNRTIFLSPSDVGTLDFDLTSDKKNQLIQNGQIGVKAFLQRTQFVQSGKSNQRNDMRFFKETSLNLNIQQDQTLRTKESKAKAPSSRQPSDFLSNVSENKKSLGGVESFESPREADHEVTSKNDKDDCGINSNSNGMEMLM